MIGEDFLAECRSIAELEATSEARKQALLEIETELIQQRNIIALKKLQELKQNA